MIARREAARPTFAGRIKALRAFLRRTVVVARRVAPECLSGPTKSHADDACFVAPWQSGCDAELPQARGSARTC